MRIETAGDTDAPLLAEGKYHYAVLNLAEPEVRWDYGHRPIGAMVRDIGIVGIVLPPNLRADKIEQLVSELVERYDALPFPPLAHWHALELFVLHVSTDPTYVLPVMDAFDFVYSLREEGECVECVDDVYMYASKYGFQLYGNVHDAYERIFET